METETTEQNVLIGLRVPPGDRWRLVDDAAGTTHESLTEAIEKYFMTMTTKWIGDFRMSPKDGKLFAIQNIEVEVKPTPVRRLNIYGEAN